MKGLIGCAEASSRELLSREALSDLEEHPCGRM